MIRTVPFKSVLDGVLRRLGMDPDLEPTGHDTARAVTEHINTRVETAWTGWPWKELEVTEERAFRPFWNVLRVYAKDDEVFLPTNKLYYVAKEANVGFAPTVSAYWNPIAIPLYGNIAFAQNDSAPIGQVMDVWNTDPRVTGTSCLKSIRFQQTEDGIDVGTALGLSTVWVTYRIPPSQFTVVPMVAGKSKSAGNGYNIGDTAYFPAEGECKRVSAFKTTDPYDEIWVIVPFPALFTNYVKLGAYADALLEVNEENLSADKVQMRLAKASKADKTAQAMLDALMDRQVEQGDRASYRRFGRQRPVYGLCAA